MRSLRNSIKNVIAQYDCEMPDMLLEDIISTVEPFIVEPRKLENLVYNHTRKVFGQRVIGTRNGMWSTYLEIDPTTENRKPQIWDEIEDKITPA